eukprot:TRINITY_DN34314_c0_g1_i1.p1 TRINITY_DN34314_c0_g1~~TRINITY_DN34314_c0_g1_i1.p1  ORF type:complete len:526 (+),score=72.16 TRINITY_DN34314_c0_g1_i1:45-1622(+)
MASAPRKLPRRVLFVGDSLTYANDLDQIVAAMANVAGELGVHVDRSVVGGAPLKELWKGHESDAQQRISEGGYDVVVLQEDLPETNLQCFQKYAALFKQKADAAGSETVLLMTWAYKNRDWIDMKGIENAHREVAERLGVRVAPAGLAWQKSEAAYGEIKLRQKDGEHPTLCGTYLMAAVVFATLWERSPIGIGFPPKGALQPRFMKILEEVAWETCQAYCSEGRKKQDRESLVVGAFTGLDRDRDSRLNCMEFAAFADFMHFAATLCSLDQEFAALCQEVGCTPEDGLSLAGFRQLVDQGSQSDVFCTDCSTDDLRELIIALGSSAPTCPLDNHQIQPDRIVIVPGNGCSGNVREANWYGWLAYELEMRGVQVGIQTMPDPFLAREDRWLPFIVDTLAGGQMNLPRTIVVGHSSGAAAAMRLSEKHQLGGVVLVAAYTSHLGDKTERKSGYFNRPWQWEKQKTNCGFIVQFASRDDPFLPWEEQMKVCQGLTPLIEFQDMGMRSHFFDYPFHELLSLLLRKLGH